MNNIESVALYRNNTQCLMSVSVPITLAEGWNLTYPSSWRPNFHLKTGDVRHFNTKCSEDIFV